MKKLLAVLFLLSLTVSAAFAKNAVPGDVIVVLRNNSGVRIQSAKTAGGVKSLSAVKSFAQSQNVRVLETFDALSDAGNKIFMVVHSDTENENDLLRKIKSNPDVLAASLNHIYTLNLPKVPNDSEYYRLWGMEAINAPKAWNKGTGSDDVYVAVIDTGIDFNHPDLKEHFSHEYSRNFVGHDREGFDPKAYHDVQGHGTHVAGTIAGVGNNALGVAGINWKAKLISLRAFNESGNGSDADITAAYNYVAELLAKNPKLNLSAVNFSAGSYYNNYTPESLIADNNPFWLVLKTISDTDRTILSVAAGNEAIDIGAPAPSTQYYDGSIICLKGSYGNPASYLGINNMITVAAATQTLGRASFSNYSSKYVDIAAPGMNIYSTIPTTLSNDTGYAVLPTLYPYGASSGTSMATPHVSGSAALLKAIYPNAKASQIKAALLGGANGDYLRDDGTSAHGLLDLTGAINFMDAVMSKDAPAKISDSNLPAGGLSQRYKTEFYASGTQPITWKVEGTLPEGLTFENGKISGTPKESGSFPFTVTASNTYGSSSLVLTLSIADATAPVIDKSTLSFDTAISVDVPVTIMTTSGTWPMIWSIGSGDVPFRINVNKDSGVLRFVPTKAGTFKFPVKVSNDAGTDSAEFTLRVKAAKAPSIAKTNLGAATLGRNYASYSVTNSYGLNYEHKVNTTVTAEGTRPVSWEVKGLPKGLAFNEMADPSDNVSISKVEIYGTPEESGDFTLTFTASNVMGASSIDIPFKVEDNVPNFIDDGGMFSMKGLEINTEFSYPVLVEGSAPISFDVSGDLPEGTHIRYEDSTPIFYGKATKTGHYHFTISAENSRGKSKNNADFDIHVIEPSAIITHILPDAVTGVSYDAKINLRSNVKMSWTVNANSSLHMKISQSGDLTGLPEKAGHFAVKVKAESPDINASFENNYALTVRAVPAIKTSSLPDGKINTEYTSTTLSADGTAPITWSVSEGLMPEGLTLSQNGYVYGTPKESGSYVFTVRAGNKAGHDTKTFTVSIAAKSSAPESRDESVTPESTDIPPKPESQDLPAPKTVIITEGSARDVSSLTIGELASIAGSGGMIAAILPEITTNDSAFYTPESIDSFANVKLSTDVPTGWTLVWNAFTRGTSDALSVENAEDDNVQFTDSEGKITITVPEDHVINISAWLDADTLYAPVVSAVEHREEVEGVASSSSGGCIAGGAGIAIFVPVIFVKLRKR